MTCNSFLAEMDEILALTFSAKQRVTLTQVMHFSVNTIPFQAILRFIFQICFQIK